MGLQSLIKMRPETFVENGRYFQCPPVLLGKGLAFNRVFTGHHHRMRLAKIKISGTKRIMIRINMTHRRQSKLRQGIKEPLWVTNTSHRVYMRASGEIIKDARSQVFYSQPAHRLQAHGITIDQRSVSISTRLVEHHKIHRAQPRYRFAQRPHRQTMSVAKHARRIDYGNLYYPRQTVMLQSIISQQNIAAGFL